MNPQDKNTDLLGRWARGEGIRFESQKAAQNYNKLTRRWLDVLALKQPDRIPGLVFGEGGIVTGPEIDQAGMFYDSPKAAAAVYGFNKKYAFDHVMDILPMCGKALDILDCRLLRWPGSPLPQGMPDNVPPQYPENEFMHASEYDRLIADPEGFILLKYLPRIFSALSFKGEIPCPLYGLHAIGHEPLLAPFSKKGGMQAKLKAMMDNLFNAADATTTHFKHFKNVADKIVRELGRPKIFGGAFTFSPFDLIGDTLRGTVGIMMDMHRQPEKLEAACRALMPFSVKMAVEHAERVQNPFVLIPLHKGADDFISQEQFERFYWPTLHAQLLELTANGLIPLILVEGAYNKRLDTIARSGLPEGRTMWIFEKTDMEQAKRKLNGIACIGGNVPASFFTIGSPEQMADYCKNLIEGVGNEGGFFLAPGVVLDRAKPKNMRVFIESAGKFGGNRGAT